jgi:hypothetical protein
LVGKAKAILLLLAEVPFPLPEIQVLLVALGVIGFHLNGIISFVIRFSFS